MSRVSVSKVRYSRNGRLYDKKQHDYTEERVRYAFEVMVLVCGHGPSLPCFLKQLKFLYVVNLVHVVPENNCHSVCLLLSLGLPHWSCLCFSGPLESTVTGWLGRRRDARAKEEGHRIHRSYYKGGDLRVGRMLNAKCSQEIHVEGQLKDGERG